MTKNTYNVGFTYTEGGFMIVQAKTQAAAEQIVYHRLTEEGFDAFRFKYECCHRDYHIHGSSKSED